MNKIMKFINFICEGKLSRFLYYSYINRNINSKGIFLYPKSGRDINGNLFYLLRELCSKKYSSYEKYVIVDKDNYDEFKNKLDTYKLDVNLVLNSSRKFYYLIATCKYLVTDTSLPAFYVKREGQVYLNTWHGTPYKCMGRRDNSNDLNIGNVQKNFIVSDYLLYPSDYMKELMLRDYMVKDLITTSKVVMSGYPRNEVFFDEERRNDLRRKLGIDDKEIIAYMPTWRGKLDDKENYINQVNQINSYLEEIDKKLNDNQIMYVNFHPFLKSCITLSNFNKIKEFDSKYETYDFLNISDMLITDYSSVFFDYSVTKRKIILFSYDEKDYFKNRGVYFDFDKLPFIKVDNVNDLICEINNNKKVNIDSFLKEYCKYECSDASYKLCNLLINGSHEGLKIESIKSEKENILLFVGNLSQNGITSSLKSLLNKVDLDKYNYYISFIPNQVKDKNVLNDVDPRVQYITFNSNFIGTFKETFYILLEKLNILSYKIIDKKLNNFYEREIRRCYGNAKFNTTIQFSGYSAAIIKMYSKFKNNKVIYLHSDMICEAKLRHNQNINLLKYYYKLYDKIAIVNETIYNSTCKLVNKDKIHIVNNIIDYESIIEKSKKDIVFNDVTLSNKNIKDIEKILDDKKNNIFINVGRFSPEKGQKRLINAFNKIYMENNNSYLFIIGGSGELYNDFISYIDTLESKNNIILIRTLYNPFPIIKKCDCFILSSYYEGFGLVLAEADILGLKTFSTNITGPSEFVKKNNGNLVDNTDDGIYNGMKDYLDGKLNNMNVDYKKYNIEAINSFYDLLR